MATVREIIAGNIKKFRKQAGFSVDALGERLDVSGKTVSAWEVGRGQPDADKTVELCQILGIDLLDLYGEQNTRDIQEEQLVSIFQSLSKEGRDALLSVALTLQDHFVVKGGE